MSRRNQRELQRSTGLALTQMLDSGFDLVLIPGANTG